MVFSHPEGDLIDPFVNTVSASGPAGSGLAALSEVMQAESRTVVINALGIQSLVMCFPSSAEVQLLFVAQNRLSNPDGLCCQERAFSRKSCRSEALPAWQLRSKASWGFH
jgi:hypothetical protein